LQFNRIDRGKGGASKNVTTPADSKPFSTNLGDFFLSQG
jgi:hypothetical protein